MDMGYVEETYSYREDQQVTATEETKTAESTTSSSLTYQWYYLSSGSKTWKKTSATGNKTSAISMDMQEARDGNQYRCVITDADGNSIPSDSATLTLAN